MLAVAAAHALPPLTEEQRVRVETARDGRDHREEAFIALIENVAGWDGTIGDEPVRLRPDLAAMVADPDRYRGEICRISGRLEQRARLPRPHENIEEWFIREESGAAALVFIVGLRDNDEEADAAMVDRFREGRRVRVVGRFYKRIDAEARDGQVREYAAFVGARPFPLDRPAADGLAQLWLVLAPVVVLLLAFLALMVYTRRQRRADQRVRRPGVNVDEEMEMADAGPLPDDPAKALAEMRRRAGEQGK